MERNVIIVAGGSGSRMMAATPKQFLIIAGKPLLYYTLKAFYDFDRSIKIILVLPSTQIEYWNLLQKEYHLDVPHQVAEGGNERFFSVKNGLLHCERNAVIAVHDGVRPFVSSATIKRCFDLAEQSGNAIPVVPLNESIRRVDEDKSEAVDRNNYKLVQTPQCFSASQLFKAYQQPFSNSFTDDASVVEAAGFKINLTEGNPENIKITHPADQAIALALVSYLFGQKN